MTEYFFPGLFTMAEVIFDTMIQEYDKMVLPLADHRTRNWYTVTKYPILPCTITAVYLLFVVFGPFAMKDRRPLELTKSLAYYNFGLVMSSLYMAVEIILSFRYVGYDFTCSVYNHDSWKDPKELRMASVLWWFYMSKYFELFDTIAMVLRKKSSQITWLHLIHHVTVLNYSWCMVLVLPGGMMWFGCFLNSTIHVFMYTYYGLSTLPSFKRFVNKWKKIMTILQLSQFSLVAIHALFHIANDCDFPWWGKYNHLVYCSFLTVMFLNFYIQAYIKKGKIPENRTDKETCTNGVDAVNHEPKTSGPTAEEILSEKKEA